MRLVCIRGSGDIMAGFVNDTMYADNVDFTGSASPAPTVTTDAQLLIGSTATPNIKVGVLTSPDNSITFGYSSPNITAVVNPSVVRDLHISPYIVSAGGLPDGASYTTIQAAINAAEGAGGGIVYIQPGTYTENITMHEGVDLVSFIGSSGNIGYTISGGETLPVTIVGNFTLDLTGASTTPTVEFKNICFTAPSGIVFTYLGNIVLLESGFITFDNCQLIGGAAATYIFSNNGFFNVNLNSCEVTETTPNTTDFIFFTGTPFLNLNVRNSYITVNRQDALILPTGCFNIFTIQNTSWAARLDSSTGSQTLNFTAVDCVLDGNGAISGDPLINFGANDGSLLASNCLMPSANGALASSTVISPAANFRFNNCTWNNPLTLGSNGRGDFVYCEFYGDTSPSITFSSSQNISLFHCVSNSSNNPAIAGSGVGTITYNDLIFVGNANFAGTLTLATTNWRPYSVSLASTDGTRVGTCNFNSAHFSVDTNGFVSLLGGGEAVDSFAMQTGTSPVVPTAAGLVNFNGAVVAAGTNPVRTDGTGANTMALEVQISQALAATDATKIGLSNFDSSRFTVDANGFVSINGAGVGETITGDSGGALSPTAGNWNILGRSGSKTSGAVSTLTVKSPPYADAGASATSTLNSGEFVTGAFTRTLPASAGLADGDLFEYVCTSASALVIQAVSAQKIRVGTLLTSAAGTLTSTNIGDSITLRFRATDGFFYATSVIGVWLVA